MVSTGTFILHGVYTGRYKGVFSFFPDKTHLVINPAADFKTGEWLQVSASKAIRKSLSEPLVPYDRGFTVAIARSGAVMSAHPISAAFSVGDSRAVALGDLDGDGDLDAVIANSSDQAETVWLNGPFMLYLRFVID